MPTRPARCPGRDVREVDLLGEPYFAETLELDDDEEGTVVATLVSRAAGAPTDRAVLHVHGFADYFFQTAYAEWWTDRGYDFYALDLRKYGRSILAHQTPNYVADLAHYHPELDLAWEHVLAGTPEAAFRYDSSTFVTTNEPVSENRIKASRPVGS